jgi:nitrogen fixation protein FixH
MIKPFTGRHMASIMVVFFGIVFAVNFTMASYASSTFGGVVVENSYVASQKYNGWLDEARAQDRLGWSAQTQRTLDGHVRLTLDGLGPNAHLTVLARHPLGRQPDRMLTFLASGDGAFVSREALPPGRWTLRIEVQDGTATWRHEDAI